MVVSLLIGACGGSSVDQATFCSRVVEFHDALRKSDLSTDKSTQAALAAGVEAANWMQEHAPASVRSDFKTVLRYQGGDEDAQKRFRDARTRVNEFLTRDCKTSVQFEDPPVTAPETTTTSSTISLP